MKKTRTQSVPVPLMQKRRYEQREAKLAADAASATRQAGTMTRGERDALRRRPILVPSPWGGTPHTDPVKAGIKAHRRVLRGSKAARRIQNRGQ